MKKHFFYEDFIRSLDDVGWQLYPQVASAPGTFDYRIDFSDNRRLTKEGRSRLKTEIESHIKGFIPWSRFNAYLDTMWQIAKDEHDNEIERAMYLSGDDPEEIR